MQKKHIKLFFLLLVFGFAALLTAELSRPFFASKSKEIILEKPINQEPRNLEEKDLQNIKRPVILPPLDNTKERVNKKTFGIYITPNNSPILPERFSGFHTGIDLEIFPGEEGEQIEIKAICKGKLLVKRFATGYGGVVIQSCNLENSPVTIIYGHLDLESIDTQIGEALDQGEKLGNLGKNKSSQTDGERKHLHLGIHKGTNINLRGYVAQEKELSNWIDPCKYLCE